MISFDKIVNKLLRKSGKVIFKYDIFEIIDPDLQEKNLNKLSKLITRLKANKIIYPLRNGVFIIPDEEDFNLNEIDLIDKYFLKLLKKYISYEIGNAYYICGQKSLEFHMKNYSIPEKIFVINRTFSKKIKIGDREIIFKTIYGKDKGKKINLYSKLSKFTKNINIDGINLKISSLELAMLESVIISDSEDGININLISKVIKKYSKVLNKNHFELIANYKYIMSINRLKEFSKNIDKDLYKCFLDIIKKNGGLFIGEGLRKF